MVRISLEQFLIGDRFGRELKLFQFRGLRFFRLAAAEVCHLAKLSLSPLQYLLTSLWPPRANHAKSERLTFPATLLLPAWLRKQAPASLHWRSFFSSPPSAT